MVSFSFKSKRSTKRTFSDDEVFSRRSFFVAGSQVVLGTALFGRLLYLTSFQNQTYSALSDGNRIKVRFLMPKRGIIRDRTGQILSDNIQTYRLMVVPDQTPKNSLAISLAELENHVDFLEDDTELLLSTIRQKPKFIPTCIADGLSWKTVCSLEVILRDYPGYFVEQGWSRHYPHSEATAHLVGYVQIPSKEDQNENPIYRLADFRVGKTGIENTFDDSLRGTAGFHRIEVNSRGRTIKNMDEEKAVDGQDITTTIDLDLQTYCQNRLKEVESGSIVVMDVHNGSVLSLVSSPTFNANLFTNGISRANWQSLLNSPRKCLHNKTIHGLYPPGSLFKMIVALAGFESGLIPLDFTCTCKGHMTLGNHRFHCWHKYGGHGKTDIVKALYQSCDIYFYEVSQIIGHKRIEEMARRFGFGVPTGIELPHERSGLIPNDEWMRRHRNRPWMKGDSANLSIGQGALLSTPLQLASMMASLINQQRLIVKPTLFHNQRPVQGNAPYHTLGLEPHNVSPEALALIQKGLNMTVNDPRGLGYRHRIQKKGCEMAGKTATCQVRRITMAERKKGIMHNEQRPWEHRDHALFCGYAPIKNPRFATAVIIEHGGAGGRVAAPIGRDVLQKAQDIFTSDQFPS